MFTDQNETKDWLFGIAVVIATIVIFLFIRQHHEEQLESEQATNAVANPPREPKTTYVVEYGRSAEPMRVAPKSVYRCVVNGQQVFSDHACASDASVVEISEPNRANAQDTSHLYDAVTGQGSRVRADRFRTRGLRDRLMTERRSAIRFKSRLIASMLACGRSIRTGKASDSEIGFGS